MINLFEVTETNKMIEQENLDVRTITLGISLLDCMDHDIDVLCQNIYNKITTVAKDLVATGKQIEMKYGIPIVKLCGHLRIHHSLKIFLHRKRLQIPDIPVSVFFHLCNSSVQFPVC